jgi:thiol-disulfide isomerase/thioredoxin
LKKHQGKKILLNVWASWCRDCIKAIPKLKALQVENPQISYVFISSDKNTKVWKKALDTYQLKGAHYFMKDGMNSAFGSFLNSNWIPRYLVINENGFVDLFKAKKITDERIVNAIKK